MISPTEYIQLKAFARQDGFFLGCLWIFTLGCFFGSMSEPTLQLGFIAGAITTPFMVYLRLKHYRDKVLSGSISFTRAFIYTTLLIVYASIIAAAATFVYFQFFDNGSFMSHMAAAVSSTEMQQTIKKAGIDAKTLNEQIQAMSQSRPIDMAFSIFFNALTSGIILAAITSLIGKKK